MPTDRERGLPNRLAKSHDAGFPTYDNGTVALDADECFSLEVSLFASLSQAVRGAGQLQPATAREHQILPFPELFDGMSVAIAKPRFLHATVRSRRYS